MRLRNKLIMYPSFFIQFFILISLFIPLGIQNALAVNFVNTNSFIDELKSKIKQTHDIPVEDISIEWLDENLEKKISYLEKIYPGKSIEIKIKDSSLKDIIGKQGLPTDVFIDNKLNRIIFIRCKIDVLKESYVAAVEIKKGSVLIDSDIKISKVPSAKINKGNIISKDSIIGKVALSDIKQGSIINSNLLKERTVVFKGNQVTIRVINGGLTLISSGEALQDGSIGQNILVQAIGFSTKRTLFAKVLEAGLVEVNLGGN